MIIIEQVNSIGKFIFLFIISINVNIVSVAWRIPCLGQQLLSFLW